MYKVIHIPAKYQASSATLEGAASVQTSKPSVAYLTTS